MQHRRFKLKSRLAYNQEYGTFSIICERRKLTRREINKAINAGNFTYMAVKNNNTNLRYSRVGRNWQEVRFLSQQFRRKQRTGLFDRMRCL